MEVELELELEVEVEVEVEEKVEVERNSAPWSSLSPAVLTSLTQIIHYILLLLLF